MTLTTKNGDRYSTAFIHDIFNMISMFIVVSLSFGYVYTHTKLDLIGTRELMTAEKDRFHYQVIYYLFATYISVDVLFIIFIPSCISSASPWLMLLHHFLTLGVLSVSLFDARFEWHMVFSLLTETSSIFLAGRRCSVKGTWSFFVSNIMFYITWFIFRIILFPFLFILSLYEWHYHAERVGTYYNVIGVSSVAVFLITMMSLVWTMQMVSKNFQDKKKSK
jgi:hypothetical protein